MFAGALANCAVSSRGDGSRERSAQRRTTGASRRGRRLERASLHSALCVRAEEPVPHIYSASGSRAPFAHLARADRGPRACFGRILGGAALTNIAGSGARPIAAMWRSYMRPIGSLRRQVCRAKGKWHMLPAIDFGERLRCIRRRVWNCYAVIWRSSFASRALTTNYRQSKIGNSCEPRCGAIISMPSLRSSSSSGSLS
jgi:hypothetical protein